MKGHRFSSDKQIQVLWVVTPNNKERVYIELPYPETLTEFDKHWVMKLVQAALQVEL